MRTTLSFLPLIIKYDIKREGSAIRRMRKSHSQAIAYLADFKTYIKIISKKKQTSKCHREDFRLHENKIRCSAVM